MTRDLNWIEMFRLVRRHLVLFILAGTVGGLGSYYVCTKLTPWFGYTMLVRSAQYKLADPDKIQDLLFGKGTNAVSRDVKVESVAYLSYNYIFNPAYAERSELISYLKEAKNINDTDFLEIITYGRNLEEAEKLSKKIFSELTLIFKERIEKTMGEKKMALDLSFRAEKELKNALADTEKSIREVGFNMILQTKKAELQKGLLDIELNRIKLESVMNSNFIRNFEVVASRPQAYKPVFPNTLLFSLLGAIAFIGLAFAAAVLYYYSEQIEEEEIEEAQFSSDTLVGVEPAQPPLYFKTPDDKKIA